MSGQDVANQWLVLKSLKKIAAGKNELQLLQHLSKMVADDSTATASIVGKCLTKILELEQLRQEHLRQQLSDISDKLLLDGKSMDYILEQVGRVKQADRELEAQLRMTRVQQYTALDQWLTQGVVEQPEVLEELMGAEMPMAAVIQPSAVMLLSDIPSRQPRMISLKLAA